MVLGDVNRTRRLAGNPSTTNVSDSDITQALTYGTSRVNTFTAKTDWETDVTHVAYGQVTWAAELYASSYIRDRFMDQSNISTENYRRAEDILRDLMNSLASFPGIIAVAGGTYRSYPLNPSATIYRSSLSPGQTLVGVSNVIPGEQ